MEDVTVGMTGLRSRPFDRYHCPDRAFIGSGDAALQLHQTGHPCIVQQLR